VSSSSTDTRTIDVVMPQMGVSVSEGTLVEWHKQPGDWVEYEEPVCDISTDKIDTEVPSPATGRLTEILVEVGATVDVGTVLARIATDARPGEPHSSEHAGAGDAGESPPAQHVGAGDAGEGPVVHGTGEAAAASGESPAAATAAAAPEPVAAVPHDAPQAVSADGGYGPRAEPADDSGGQRRRYTPVVMRMAEEHGIDLGRIEGTGRGGRVRKKDVLAHLAAREAEPAAPEPPLHIESPYRRPPRPRPRPRRPLGRRRRPPPPRPRPRRPLGRRRRPPPSPRRRPLPPGTASRSRGCAGRSAST
jgi:pyruvate dehydrogenase E2 component (dihydrolipoamide acetyltransferase)